MELLELLDLLGLIEHMVPMEHLELISLNKHQKYINKKRIILFCQCTEGSVKCGWFGIFFFPMENRNCPVG
jgi:hypothetical protein